MARKAETGERERHPWSTLYRIAIMAFSVFILLDAFVIPRSYAVVSNSSSSSSSSTQSTTASSSTSNSSSDSSSSAVITSDSYTNGDTQIQITTDRVNGTTVYVADIYVSDISEIQTAFAQNVYGKNVTETTSSMAEDNNAILAINGDYYGAQNSGYVIRNGVLYRSEAASSDQEDLVIYSDGTFEVICEGDITAQELLDNGAWQVFSFGPGLIENGEIAVTQGEETGKAMASNPRTAIGQVSDGHYVMVVADGRTSESSGLSLYELAEYMQGLGCTTAYNLDGGGSSTMYFNGEVINNPTTNGDTIKERKVSDIVYIGA
ncbi:MAG: phosphodiester glycosidase family protein [Coriobacteriales bacterium]|jgi:exopolysaccharide biosynthesis protein